MMKLLIALLLSFSATAQTGWYISGGNLFYSDGAGNTVQIGFTPGSFLTPTGNGSGLTGLTKSQVGLSNVNNTSDANKPISTATQSALDAKLATDGNGSGLTGLTKSQVGLSNVDNTSNATERAASAYLQNKTIATFNYAADAQANDSYVISLSPAPSAYTTGMVIFFKANTANTTGCTINVNGLGAKNILKRVSTTPATGDILAGMVCMLIYDGTSFIILNPVVN